MKPTHRTDHRKLANWFALLTIATLLLSGFAVPTAQAAPQAPQATTIIAALSDYGSGDALEQTVATMIAGWNPAAIVTAGDNWHYGSCNTYAACVGNYYNSYVTAHTFMPTMGNHDYDNPPVGLTAWNNYFTWLPTNPDAQRRWYDFMVGDVHFFMLDGNGNQATQSTWLSTAVPASTAKWNIAVIHQAPYSNGAYGDISASQLTYGTYGIDFVISGHNHHYERLVKADGGKTVRYFIDGYGGTASHSQCNSPSSSATSEVCLANTPGAIKITASDTSIMFEYYNSAGVVQNTYTQVIGPEITTSVSSLAPFSTTPGTPSAVQTYTVSGSDLTADISINAPAGFAIKTDSGAYGSSITLPRTGGVVNTTNISVRLTGAAGGSFSGNITHTSTGATQKDVAVSGIVGTAPICVTSRISVSADDAEQRNDTNAVDLDGDTDTHSLQTYRAYAGSSTSTLNWWGLRFLNVNVPQGATITSADVTFRANLASGATASGMTLWGQLATSPATFTTSANNITGRTRTSASASWSVAQWTSGSDYATPDLSAVVQEIVNQSGWAANNAMVVIGQTTVTQNRSAISRDSTNGSTLAPLLEVCYTTLPAGPTITTSGTLSPFSTTPGIPSAAQTYTVAGSNLTANISINAPTGFELKTDSGAYGSSLTLPQVGGVVDTTTISVRLTGTAEGTFSGNITHASAGATTKNVAVSGTVSLCMTTSFQQGTGSYSGARDTHIQQANVTYNYGAATPLMVDSDEPNSSGNDVSALLYWDLSSIPAGSTIESASVTVYVENVTQSPGFDMYAMTQAWTEGTGNGSATANGATWNTYNGSNAWPGGAGGASDRGSTALANFMPTATGSYQAALNATGEAVLEGWINTPANNKGFMIHAGSTTNGLDLTSKEGTTVANRPKLTVGYCLAPTTPYILTSGTLSEFSSSRNVPSTEQSYTVSGGNLTGNIVITAPADFLISTTSGSGFGPTVNLTPIGGTVSSTPIYVQFLRSTLGTSTGNITHTSAGATTRNVAVSGTTVNGAPTVTLVQPSDNATGVSTSPSLQATVTDPDLDTMSVSFYGRVAGEGTGEDFTLVVIPDTQNMSTSYPAVFNSMTQWIVAQKTMQNIVFATHVGDIVNTASNTTQWGNADTAMDYLDTGSVAYSVGPGNHDLGGQYNTYFGPSRFTGNGHYQGSYAANQNENNYSFLTASGMDFIIINLQYSTITSGAQLDWADALLKANPNKRGIVEQHNILNTDNTWNNQAVYTALADNPNLFLMLCGHMHSGSDGSAYRLETRSGMQSVHVLLTDYQDVTNGGNGYLRNLRFSPTDDKIYATIYSPYIDASLTSASNYEQFAMNYDMASGAAFELIGTVTGVTSGSPASVSWLGHDPNTEYEWYAVASDGTTSTTSATWAFTTGTGTAAVPKAPVVTSITQSGGNVVLGWDEVTQDVNNIGTMIIKYQVYGSQDPYFTSDDTLLGERTATELTFTHVPGSTGMTSWYYLVRAVNSAGSSDFSERRTGWFRFTLVPGS